MNKKSPILLQKLFYISSISTYNNLYITYIMGSTGFSHLLEYVLVNFKYVNISLDYR